LNSCSHLHLVHLLSIAISRKSVKNSIVCTPTDKIEISTVIRTLKNNKSLGPDGIGPVLVKLIENLILDPLTYIFNFSFYWTGT